MVMEVRGGANEIAGMWCAVQTYASIQRGMASMHGQHTAWFCLSNCHAHACLGRDYTVCVQWCLLLSGLTFQQPPQCTSIATFGTPHHPPRPAGPDVQLSAASCARLLMVRGPPSCRGSMLSCHTCCIAAVF